MAKRTETVTLAPKTPKLKRFKVRYIVTYQAASDAPLDAAPERETFEGRATDLSDVILAAETDLRGLSMAGLQSCASVMVIIEGRDHANQPVTHELTLWPNGKAMANVRYPGQIETPDHIDSWATMLPRWQDVVEESRRFADAHQAAVKTHLARKIRQEI